VTPLWLLVAVVLLLAILLRPKQQAPAEDGAQASGCAEPPDDEPEGPDAVGVIAIEDSIDLHGFQPRDVPDVVDAYLEAAAEQGLSEVRLIHGRGKGVQRQRVQSLLARHELVASFRDAPAHRGGWGATIARLRCPPETGPQEKSS
jgi:dsDNA-specific endonuclease/ATPase MutS2